MGREGKDKLRVDVTASIQRFLDGSNISSLSSFPKSINHYFIIVAGRQKNLLHVGDFLSGNNSPSKP